MAWVWSCALRAIARFRTVSTALPVNSTMSSSARASRGRPSMSMRLHRLRLRKKAVSSSELPPGRGLGKRTPVLPVAQKSASCFDYRGLYSATQVVSCKNSAAHPDFCSGGRRPCCGGVRCLPHDGLGAELLQRKARPAALHPRNGLCGQLSGPVPESFFARRLLLWQGGFYPFFPSGQGPLRPLRALRVGAAPRNGTAVAIIFTIAWHVRRAVGCVATLARKLSGYGGNHEQAA